MIRGIGIDLTDIERFDKLHNPATFIKRVLSPAEYEAWQAKSGKRALEFLAGRFSAKEAYSKAYGTGLGTEVNFQDLELDYDDKGKPYFKKHPYAGRAHISISHTDTQVVTEVILEEES